MRPRSRHRPAVRRSIVLANEHLSPVVDIAVLAEQHGFFRTWTTEYPGRDAVLRAAAAGLATSHMHVGTGIAYGFTRHPLALAAAALDLHELTGGRFALGLGAGTTGMRGTWFGLPTDAPVARLRELVEFIRCALASDGAFSFQGTYYRSRIGDLRLAGRAGALPPLPLYGSGLNAAMVREAASWCDGVLLHPLAVAERHATEVLGPSLEAASRHRTEQPYLAQWLLTSVSTDRDEARRRARKALAFYLATPSYRRHFERTAWLGAVDRIIDRFKQLGAQWNVLAEDVPDELVDELCIAGTAAECRQALAKFERRFRERGVDEVVFQVCTTDTGPEETHDALIAAVQALGDDAARTGFRTPEPGQA